MQAAATQHLSDGSTKIWSLSITPGSALKYNSVNFITTLFQISEVLRLCESVSTGKLQCRPKEFFQSFEQESGIEKELENVETVNPKCWRPQPKRTSKSIVLNYQHCSLFQERNRQIVADSLPTETQSFSVCLPLEASLTRSLSFKSSITTEI